MKKQRERRTMWYSESEMQCDYKEVRKAMKRMKSVRAAGSDDIGMFETGGSGIVNRNV